MPTAGVGGGSQALGGWETEGREGRSESAKGEVQKDEPSALVYEALSD